VAFNVSAATEYRVAVDGYNAASGRIQLTLSFRPVAIRPPRNDHFRDRLPLEGSELVVEAGNVAATKEEGEPNHALELGGASVWWTWTAPASGGVRVSTEGSGFDTLLAVYRGTLLTNLTLVAADDDLSTNSSSSRVEFEAVAGDEYQVAVDGFNGEMGDIRLSVTAGNPVRLEIQRRPGDGHVLITIRGAAGPLVIEASPDLVAWSQLMSWASLDTPLQLIGFAADPPQRFYRARLFHGP
jgi:hypothetical protein